MKKARPLWILLACLVVIGVSWGILTWLQARPATVDERVHHITELLKCPVCQGEAVADSSATLAQQIRESVREQVNAGKSDDEILDYFKSRYGEDILLTPPWQGFPLLIWLTPIIFIAGALLWVGLHMRDQLAIARAQAPEALPVQTSTPWLAALDEIEFDYQLGNIDHADYLLLTEKYRHLAHINQTEDELDEQIEAELQQLKEQDSANSAGGVHEE